MVQINVKNDDTVDPMVEMRCSQVRRQLLRKQGAFTMSSADSNIVDETKSGRRVLTTMMPWRSDGNERTIYGVLYAVRRCLRKLTDKDGLRGSRNRVNSLTNGANRTLDSGHRFRTNWTKKERKGKPKEPSSLAATQR
jgi:hypothetical protein